MVFFLVAGSSPWAGELNAEVENTLNIFASGTPAVAAEVNENFDKVADAVNDNHDRITTNTADIANNTAEIATNASEIEAHATAIAANAAEIAANAASIATNTAGIGTNAATIATHSGTLTSLAADLAAVAGEVAALEVLIDANTAAIALNASAIADHELDITTNIADIAANADAIDALRTSGNPVGIACAGNDENDIMVRVGPLCVDMYEASVWNTPEGGVTQYGLVADTPDYPCGVNGSNCGGSVANIYARSEAGVMPSTDITWFQAVQACANSGKRLLTNAEWQMAASGTPSGQCNIDSGARADTDANPNCVSNWGVVNMVGNIDEWVADWMAGTRETGGPGDNGSTGVEANNATFGEDGAIRIRMAWHQVDGSKFPSALYRGGDYDSASMAGEFALNGAHGPALSFRSIGFRCAR